MEPCGCVRLAWARAYFLHTQSTPLPILPHSYKYIVKFHLFPYFLNPFGEARALASSFSRARQTWHCFDGYQTSITIQWDLNGCAKHKKHKMSISFIASGWIGGRGKGEQPPSIAIINIIFYFIYISTPFCLWRWLACGGDLLSSLPFSFSPTLRSFFPSVSVNITPDSLTHAYAATFFMSCKFEFCRLFYISFVSSHSHHTNLPEILSISCVLRRRARQ